MEGKGGRTVSHEPSGKASWAEPQRRWASEHADVWVGRGSQPCCLFTCSVIAPVGAWYSAGALMISVPALLGYLQEVCRARLPESELMRRKYHSVRQEDLQRVRLSRPEAVAEVKTL